MSRISKSSLKSSGIIWFWMKLKQSRTTQVDVGKSCFNSMLETDFFWQVHQSKILWLNYGLCCISLCQSCSIITSSSKSGSQRISKPRLWTKVNLTSISLNVFMPSLNPSCWEGLREMSSKKLDLKLRSSFIVIWLSDRECFIKESKTKSQQEISFNLSKTSRGWRIWWI